MNKIICTILMFFSLAFANGDDRSRVLLGSDIIVEQGDSYESVVSIGGDVTVYGRVRESAVAIGGDVYVKNSGIIEGNAVSVGGAVILEMEGEVDGDIVEIEGGNIGNIFRRTAGWGDWHLPFIFRSFSLIGILIIALIGVLIFPGFIENFSRQLESLPGKSLLFGFLALLLLVPGIILLALSLIGIPFIPILLLAYFLSYFLGYFAVSKILGQRLLAAFKSQKHSIVLTVMLGAIIIWLGGLVPFFSSLLHLTVLISGLGSFITSRINVKLN